MIIGYARTSTADQKAGLEAQVRDLKAAGCDWVADEHISGASLVRVMLDDLLVRLEPGDVLMVTKPDRLARSTGVLISIAENLMRRDIGLVVLSMGGQKLDTRNPTSKLMLTILAAVATWEREIMLERQREGIIKAKGEKKYKGRKPVLNHLHPEVQAMIDEGLRPGKIAESLRIHKRSVQRMIENGAVQDRAPTPRFCAEKSS